jgi:hypothetical protein
MACSNRMDAAGCPFRDVVNSIRCAVRSIYVLIFERFREVLESEAVKIFL